MPTTTITIEIPDRETLYSLSLDEINRLSNTLDQKRQEINTLKREVAEARKVACMERELDIWGVSEEVYRRCKDESQGANTVSRELDGLLTRRSEVEGYLLDPKYASNKTFLKETLSTIDNEVEEVRKQLAEAEKAALPFHVLLNKERAKMAREMRKIQQANAGVAKTGTAQGQTKVR